MAVKSLAYSAALLFSCFFSCVHSQTGSSLNSFDTLKQYSYLIYGFKATPEGGMIHLQSGGGTGFFIRMGGRTFLVSAKHVLTRWRADSLRKIIDYPDTLRVRIPNLMGDTVDYPISFTKINDTISGEADYKEPDVYAVEFPSAANYKINSIESFIDTCIFKEVDTIAFYGYPGTNEPLNNIQALERYRSRRPTLSIGFYTPKTTFPFTLVDQRYDNFDYGVLTTDTLYKQGCSGSPLFKKDSATGRLIFAGIMSRGSGAIRSCLIVRPEFIMQKIRTLNTP